MNHFHLFQAYIPKKRKHFGIKIYIVCDESGHTHDMKLYLGRDSHTATDDMTATRATVRHLTCRAEGLGHKIFVDNFFSPTKPFYDLDRRKISSCGQYSPAEKTCPMTLYLNN
jgi:hypothetical protein